MVGVRAGGQADNVDVESVEQERAVLCGTCLQLSKRCCVPVQEDDGGWGSGGDDDGDSGGGSIWDLFSDD